MSESLLVRSHRGTYAVDFVSSWHEALAAELRAGDRLIVDRAILALHPAIAVAGATPPIAVEATEDTKTWDAIGRLMASLVEGGVTRSSRLVAIGGGVVQDAVCFAASILLRGIDWIFVPTTLLSQCDSCVGSKSSVNFGGAKNQLGTFYPPARIVIDTAFLDSLPAREIRSGIGEMAHYFLLTSEADFERIEHRADLLVEARDGLRELIRRSLAIKQEMVERDEFDQGPRAVFNYGHTFGHAIETATDHAVPHGVAVAYGMDLANVLSLDAGWVDARFRNRVRESLAPLWRGESLSGLSRSRFFAALARDKKNAGKERRAILTRGFGAMFKTTLGDDAATNGRIEQFFAERLYEGEL